MRAPLDCFQLPPTQGDSAKTKEANSKDYNSTHKTGDDFKSKGQDYMATGQHKYENAKASADKHTSSFYHSGQDKAHSAKDSAYSAKDTVAHKTHEMGNTAKAHADDAEDETLSKSEKAKEKASFRGFRFRRCQAMMPCIVCCMLQCHGQLSGRRNRSCGLLLQSGLST